jgi:3'-phosphoadenosine 5'-phosphosulfate sulfotransferase (PAPS reductase)/FAD synthetase
MKPKMHIASCSFGKDSIATILLALENNEPLDRVVFAEVMFDHERGISGEIPEHIEWIYSTAIPKLESMGVKVDVVKAEDDYVTEFHKVRGSRTKVKERIGKKQGFLLGGFCRLNSMGKVNPVRKYYRQFREQGYDIVGYVGIATDEPIRLARLKGSDISLLAKYGYTEKMAMEKCQEYGLVSPIYATCKRGGCWFCPNQGAKGFNRLRNNHPELWEELRMLARETNLISVYFCYDHTFEQMEAKMNAIDAQLKLFDN